MMSAKRILSSVGTPEVAKGGLLGPRDSTRRDRSVAARLGRVLRENIQPKACTYLAGAAIALLFVGLTAMTLFGQISDYAVVRGIVRDPSGAAIPDVKVTLTDEPRNLSRTFVTNSAGEYVFAEVVPSTYTLAVEAKGFKKYEQIGVVVETQARVEIDVSLQLGEVTQTVEVTGAAPLIQTDTASQGAVLNEYALSDLPNIGRNVFVMARVTPNVIQLGSPWANRMQDQSNTSAVTVGGGPSNANDYILDGMPTETLWGTVAIIPSIEAVSEMKLNVETYDAEMGRTMGGVYSTSYKSGTNDIHGDLFGSIRRTSWDANFFFNNKEGIPLGNIPNDNWAGNLGGPLTIPHLYNGKNRTFWFIAYEGYDNGFALNQEFYVPTAAEKQGNFSNTNALVNGAIQPLVIYDPSTTVTNPDGTYTRTPFPGNVIPPSRLNSVGQTIATYFPTATSMPAYYGDLDVLGTGTSTSPGRYYMGKLDEQFTNWWRATLSYTHEWTFEPQQCYFCGVASPNQYALKRDEDITSVNSIFSLSPTSVLAVRYGFARWPNYLEDYKATGFDPINLGFPAALVNQMQGFKFPDISYAQSGYNMSTAYNQYWNFPQNAVSAMLSKSIGRHSLKIGFDFREMHVLGDAYNDESGNYTFNGIFTQSSPVGALPNSGADVADLLLGYPYSGDITKSVLLNDYNHYYAAYLQDDFRVNSRLTVNLGLRWEREYGLSEIQNRIWSGFNEDATNPLAAYTPGFTPKGVVEWAGQNGNPTSVFNPSLNKMSPRLGAAYQIDSKTVIRGGFGVFWGAQYTGTTLAPASFFATSPYVATTNGYATSAGTLSNPFPNGLIEPAGLSAGDLAGVGQSITIPDPKGTSPRVLQYSVDLQRQLPTGIALEVGYVGSHGSDLPMSGDQNVLDPTYFSMGAEALASPGTNPFYNTPGGVGVLGTPTVSQSQLILPYPAYSNVEFVGRSQGKSHYDSLIVVGRKRMGQGLTFVSSVTWDRSYDRGTGAPQNPLNYEANWALSTFGAPFLAGLGAQYELPVGKGKPLLNNNAVANGILGGWQFNVVMTLRAGFPLQPTQTQNFNSPFGYDIQYPNATGVAPAVNPGNSIESRLDDDVNPAAFSQAPEFTFGNSSRTIPMRGNGLSQFDLSLFKTIPIYERVMGQFRIEAINAFNTPQFTDPNMTVGSPSFGQITGENSEPRQLQMDIRFMW